MAIPSLSVAGVAKRFGKVRALAGVGFEIAPGEVFGYLGPNGAGKTTTLRSVLGLVRPDAGEVLLFGSPPSARARQRIGFLPGELRLHEEMTGRAALDHFARFRRRHPPVLQEKLLDAFGLSEPTLGRRIKLLSHGTRQKIGLVIAMQHDPDLLLLDEPSTGLDPLVQQVFRQSVREAAIRGRSVLFSSHVLSEVESVCDRVAILRGGALVAMETIETLRRGLLRRMEVRFHGPAPGSIAGTPGVARSRVSGSDAVLWVRGDLNPVLRALAAADVENLVFPEPQLEDVFLGFYRDA